MRICTAFSRARTAGTRYCFVQGYGHVVAEHAGLERRGKARSFFDALKVAAA